MMRKRFLSLTCALVLCLGLLPATALAAGSNTVYVGGVALTSTDSETVYATTNKDTGVVSPITSTEGEPVDWNIKWDGSTLTLHNATIREYVPSDTSTFIPGTAIGVLNESGDAKLTITLEGANTIEDVSTGIFVLANSSSTGGATLTITGSGSLDASGSVNGIMVQSNSGDATLTIQSADVTLTSNSGNGVTVQAGSGGTQGHTATLTVNGGKLTASGAAGIQFNASNSSYDITTELTVSDNALVDTRNGGIDVYGAGDVTPTVADDATTGGIVFDGDEGTVYGSVELQENITINEGESLTLDDGASLNAGGHNVIVDGGTVDESLKTSLGDSVIYKVTKVELDKTSLTLGVGKSETLTATITPSNATNPNVTWSSDTSGIVTIAPSTDTKTATITATGTGTTTIKATVGGKSAECTVTVNAAATVHVTSVSLDKANLELTEGETAQLTATVLPDNATNKNVTWSSDNPSVATVNNGVVSAVSEGTATITVTTEDGNKTATCAVTVTRPYIPPANPNYRVDVTTTAGGTVTKDPAAAKAGETVTLTPTPDAGYEVGDVTVTDRFGNAVEVTENADGTYTFTMPNGQVKVAVTFVEVQPEPLPFTDVAEGDWFHDAVRYVYDHGLMDGVGDGQFAPNATTNRAMVVTILYRLAGEPAVSGDAAFTDVADGLWYTDAVLWAAQKGIVNGISETEFAPSGDLTREQLATILYRYAESAGYDVSASADLSGFPDAGDIQSYATQALSWAVAEGLLQGFEDDSLQPGGTATRAQIATILMRFCETVAK